MNTGELDLEAAEVSQFQSSILGWYDRYRRDLPWRGDPDPYHILVSEIMLQQTQVDRVIPKYLAFLDRFPALESLAAASLADVIREWHGLGYNRRALNLKRAAETACSNYACRLPTSIEELQRLPGIGMYTSRAVACFAFNQQVAVVDTNVRRVLSNLIGRRLTEKEAWVLAERVLPAGRAADWNQALMDYGALLPRPRTPQRVKPTETFATTNRFWRGRIVDALCAHHTLTLDALLEALPYPNRDEQRVRALARSLHEEGLVKYDFERDVLALPE